MRAALLSLLLTIVSFPIPGQPRVRGRNIAALQRAGAAEIALKQAAEQLAAQRAAYERDVAVLRRVRAADQALVDATQSSIAIQKAYEQIDAAKALMPELTVMQGLTRSLQEVEAARRSPGSADFGRLRSFIRDEALGPASRVAVRNGTYLQEETLAWIKVQELIAGHLRALSEISSESLRAAEEER